MVKWEDMEEPLKLKLVTCLKLSLVHVDLLTLKPPWVKSERHSLWKVMLDTSMRWPPWPDFFVQRIRRFYDWTGEMFDFEVAPLITSRNANGQRYGELQDYSRSKRDVKYKRTVQ